MLLISILAISCKNTQNLKNSIKIQSLKSNKSQLDASSEILNKRLEIIADGDFDVKVVAQENQIQIFYDDNWDTVQLRKLILSKGDFALYKLHTYADVKQLIGADSSIFQLLNKLPDADSSEFVVIADLQNKKAINQILEARNYENCKFVWSENKISSTLSLYALDVTNESTKTFVKSNMTDFKLLPEINRQTESIAFSFNSGAVQTWADYTRLNINHSLAFILEDDIISVPRIMSEIKEGRCQVSGSFSHSEANYILALLSSRELPVDFEVVE